MVRQVQERHLTLEALSYSGPCDIHHLSHGEDLVWIKLLTRLIAFHILQLKHQKGMLSLQDSFLLMASECSSMTDKHMILLASHHGGSMLSRQHILIAARTLYSLSLRMAGAPLFFRWFSWGFVIFRSGTT